MSVPRGRRPAGSCRVLTAVPILGSAVRFRWTAVSPRSSSGPGHRPLKAKITGSNPVRGTARARATARAFSHLIRCPHVNASGLPGRDVVPYDRYAINSVVFRLTGRLARRWPEGERGMRKLFLGSALAVALTIGAHGTSLASTAAPVTPEASGTGTRHDRGEEPERAKQSGERRGQRRRLKREQRERLTATYHHQAASHTVAGKARAYARASFVSRSCRAGVLEARLRYQYPCRSRGRPPCRS